MTTTKIKILIIIISAIGFCFGFMLMDRYYDLKIVPLSIRASFLNTDQSMASISAPYLERMIKDAEREGMCLIVTSSYRTRAQQEKIYNQAKDKSIVALPGKSEHETGLAVDLGGCALVNGVRNDIGERIELKKDFIDLPEYQWLLANASRYGFYQSYTEGNGSGFPVEAWHWKYKY